MNVLKVELIEILNNIHFRKRTQFVHANNDYKKLLNEWYGSIPTFEQIFLLISGLNSRPLCPICSDFIVLNKGHKNYSKTCSKKCSAKLQKKTGDKQRSIEKSKKTNMERYGAESYTKTEDFRKKYTSTMLKKYGVEHALQNTNLMNKKIRTDSSLYGGIPLRNEIIKKRHAESIKIRSLNNAYELVTRCMNIHNDKYTYSVYENTTNKVEIVCPEHGIFKQSLIIHSYGHGCPDCANKQNGLNSRTSPTEFFNNCRIKHDNRYLYDEETYIKSTELIKIVCQQHGEFWQRACDHLHGGHGCPKCGNTESKAEREIKEFLESLYVKVHSRRRDLIPPLEIDLFLPEYNIAIEYCGLLWHSSKYGKDSEYHIKKHIMCEENNIQLITIFEDEWKETPNKVMSLLQHFVGKSPRGDSASKCTIKEIPWIMAKSFLTEHHILGSGTPGTYYIGAFDREQKLVSVMVFSSKFNERGLVDVVKLKKFVTDEKSHMGLTRKMLKWSIKKYGLIKIIAFVDRRWFSGSSLLKSGFSIIEKTNPSLWWTDFRKRYHERHFRKVNLIQSTNKTKRVLLEEKGIYPIWDCGKMKLEYIK
jgi:hypothetical protein